MDDESCFFIGHHDAGPEVYSLLKEAVERHITEFGVTIFYVGGYGSFDRMAARATIDAKERHPAVKLWRLLAYHPYDRPVEVPEGFDGTYYPPDMEYVPKRFAIVRANEAMIRECSHLIAYMRCGASNTRNFVDYARRRQKRGLMQITLLNSIDGGMKDA